MGHVTLLENYGKLIYPTHKVLLSGWGSFVPKVEYVIVPLRVSRTSICRTWEASEATWGSMVTNSSHKPQLHVQNLCSRFPWRRLKRRTGNRGAGRLKHGWVPRAAIDGVRLDHLLWSVIAYLKLLQQDESFWILGGLHFVTPIARDSRCDIALALAAPFPPRTKLQYYIFSLGGNGPRERVGPLLRIA